ncbi:thermonuclease family protein [Affinirhizobium pseudoryzae]|uniref:thermonuclease family protein n=1 Tax=Allorhizobium pseudoryzae TaxID=379684 RepID=UPI0013EE3637|nr:thermonuclease family protein [Allorhizobium pseudoryzae]
MAQATASKGRRPRRKAGRSRQASGKGRTWPWLLALVATAGAIAAFEHKQEVMRWLPTGVLPLSKSQATADNSAASARSDSAHTLPVHPVQPVARPAAVPAKPEPGEMTGKGFTGTFYFCGTSGLDNCVQSGDLFWFRKQAINLADVVAPETEKARCQAERDKGFAAKVRLRDLLNAGAFELVDWPNSDEDPRGRKLRVVMRNGQSIGAQLIREGLVHGVSDMGKGWC